MRPNVSDMHYILLELLGLMTSHINKSLTAYALKTIKRQRVVIIGIPLRLGIFISGFKINRPIAMDRSLKYIYGYINFFKVLLKHADFYFTFF